jgi:hypothetical protein
VSEEARIERVERALREARAPAAVPARLRDVARREALGGASRRRSTRTFVAAAAAVAAAAVLAIGLSLRGGGDEAGAYTIALSGSGTASGQVTVSDVDRGVRHVSITLRHLDPAPAGGWYEMWYTADGIRWKVASFDVPASGSVELQTAMPASAEWTRCWVSLRGPSQTPKRILESS